MNNSEVVNEIEENVRIVLYKLSKYKLLEEIKDLKTMSDSLQMLINMYLKSVQMKFHSLDGISNIRYYSKESMIFFEDILSKLNIQIENTGKIMKNLLTNNKQREYRDCLITYEKLTNTYQRLSYEFEPSKAIIEKYCLNN